MDVGPRLPEPERRRRLVRLSTLEAPLDAPLDAGEPDPSDPGDPRDPGRLRRALAAGELRLYFQPVVALATGTAMGFEALLRWEHPGRGLLLPEDFLPTGPSPDGSPVAADDAVLALIGEQVLARALAVVAEIRPAPRDRSGGDQGRLAVTVNLGGEQLARPGLADTVLDLLTRNRLPGAALTLEVTASTALGDFDVAATELGRLRAAGVGMCLGDYGSGWSGLGRLLELPFSSLKLDRTLTGQLGRDPRIGAVVTSTAALAADLGLDLVVEGVETEEQRRTLLEAGYTRAQGWLFGHAVPADELPGVLAAPRTAGRHRWHPSQGRR